jgi:hypothetical protein
MLEITSSLQKQLEELEENLILVQERKSEFVEATSVPLQLEKEERRLIKDIAEIRKRLDVAQGRRARPGKPIPSLLPYLPDRHEQEEQLKEALSQLEQTSGRLMVCLVHGDEFQSHDMYLERLEKECLPRLLALDPGQSSIKTYHLSWPSGLRQIGELPARLNRHLAEKILNNSQAAPEDIQLALAAHPGPVVIHTHLLTEDWQQFGPECLTRYLQFWQEWPSPGPGTRLYVFLFIKYQMKQNLGFLKRLSYKSTNDRMLGFLNMAEFSRFDRLFCVVLPQLVGISQSQVENWARDDYDESFCPLEVLISEIRRFYHEHEAQTSSSLVPMEILARQLSNILSQHLIPKERYT